MSDGTGRARRALSCFADVGWIDSVVYSIRVWGKLGSTDGPDECERPADRKYGERKGSKEELSRGDTSGTQMGEMGVRFA